MRCDQTQTLLFDYVDDRLADQVRMEVGDHLETCSNCQSDYQGILDLQAQANVWHDLPVPKWQPPAIPGRSLFDNFQQWFPSLASAAALLGVLAIYVGQPASAPVPALDPVAATDYAGRGVPVAYGSGGDYSANPELESLMLDNRSQRQAELRALVRLLRLEMDRRSEETEESLRYVIAHQLQGQREIDDLYDRLQQINYKGPGNRGQM